MLSIVNAAEMQFRHEFETRQRELALLGSIRERRAAQDASAGAVTAPSRASAVNAPVTVGSAPRAAWARPIGMHVSTATVCAAA